MLTVLQVAGLQSRRPDVSTTGHSTAHSQFLFGLGACWGGRVAVGGRGGSAQSGHLDVLHGAGGCLSEGGPTAPRASSGACLAEVWLEGESDSLWLTAGLWALFCLPTGVSGGRGFRIEGKERASFGSPLDRRVGLGAQRAAGHFVWPAL